MTPKVIMEKLKINTYTDESGQDTQGKLFVVVSVVINPDLLEKLETRLLCIEKKSRKRRKWTYSNISRRVDFCQLILTEDLFHSFRIYYSVFRNKLNYSQLISSHIARSTAKVGKATDHQVKIFLDSMDKKTISTIAHEIKKYDIDFKKIKGLNEESNVFIRLADCMCGLIRDVENKDCPGVYKKIFKHLEEV